MLRYYDNEMYVCNMGEVPRILCVKMRLQSNGHEGYHLLLDDDPHGLSMHFAQRQPLKDHTDCILV
jgi:hypothetical protein